MGGVRRYGWSGLLAIVLCVMTPAAATADTYKPTRFDDPPPGKCKPDDCSLREAIDAANAESDRDVLRLAKGRYKIQRPHVPGFEDNSAGDFRINYPATIRGKGPKATKIDANGLDRVFYVGGISSTSPVTFASLMMKGGDPDAVPNDPQHPPEGGAIYAYTEAVKLNRVAITHNDANSGGGARFQVTSLKVSKSTISGNTAIQGGGLYLPSAIFSTPTATIRETTISGNHAGRGGGVLAEGLPGMSLEPPVVTLVNSTVAKNSISGGMGTAQGGGILATGGGTMTLDNSTVAYNQAGDAVQNGAGGGVYQGPGATFNLGDTLIAQNIAAQGGSVGTGVVGSQCAGAFAGSGGVLVELQPGTVCAISGDIREPDNAEVGELANNGGPTRTVALEPQSDAIGYAVSCPPRDQRGILRPATGCDTGAYEFEGGP